MPVAKALAQRVIIPCLHQPMSLNWSPYLKLPVAINHLNSKSQHVTLFSNLKFKIHLKALIAQIL